MTEAELIDVAREAVVVTLVVSAPSLLTALAVGLVISIFQTLTQIQEQTLTFVPKLMLVFASLVLFLPFILGQLTEFWKHTMDRVIAGGG
ncbi:flagellar biosynthesis protein FliQ [Magnetospirillum fulvum]|jgi:flagellar biosynthetic protein FliQ|uniref:Flagellar biosynthetic protein FliQ n=1 Tax=Magnetospirillum fulvum MGU-K5 TaxID=1316936 RepID=S9TX74_MAGFU|nr:flagellar biosynthesis protein FliQ [Magnetospirillum fulvum]EPY02985.1 flagellar biosynthesis pathway [Magnetospirillum fulvum MGU-K5]